MTNNIV